MWSSLRPPFASCTWKIIIGPLTKESLLIHGITWVGRNSRWFSQGSLKDGTFSSFVASLRACTKNKDLCRGLKLHDDILRRGLIERCSDALVTMYAKCGELGRAKELFDMYKSRDLLTWTALISGYVQKGHGLDALSYFEQMQQEGISPNAVTFTCVFKACGSIKAADKGARIHDKIAKQGLPGNNIVLGTALVDMYAKCGALVKAQRVLEELPVRNVFPWTALIHGYAQLGKGAQALDCFERMQSEGHVPNAVTFISVAKACASIGSADKADKIYDAISKQSILVNDIALGNAVVDMYAKCGALGKAHCLLEGLPVRNATSWTSLLAGYAEKGEAAQALNCFEKMQEEGLSPDSVTFACLLKACSSIRAIDMGEKLHNEIAQLGLLGSSVVLGTALVEMYAKCGALDKAQQVLEELPVRDVVSWNALIAGYNQQGEGRQALYCYERMQGEGLIPDVVTFSSVLKACASVGAADKGVEICDELAKQGMPGNDLLLGTAMVDMYATCGALTKARCVLEELPVRDVISWNALIAGYTRHCEGEALMCYECMQRDRVSPDAATFSSLLSACSRLGLVEEAQVYFMDMIAKHGLEPNIEHYTCMVGLLGHMGHLAKAVEVMKKLPSSEMGICSALLGACQSWGDIDVGRWAFENAKQLNKSGSNDLHLHG